MGDFYAPRNAKSSRQITRSDTFVNRGFSHSFFAFGSLIDCIAP